MKNKFLLLMTVFIIASCTASISVKAEGDPDIYVEPQFKEKNKQSEPYAPKKINPEDLSIPRNPTQHVSMIPCDTEEYVLSLLNDFEERLLFDARGLVFPLPAGSGNINEARAIQAPVSFYVNMETGKWSLITHPLPTIACLFINGDGFTAGGSK